MLGGVVFGYRKTVILHPREEVSLMDILCHEALYYSVQEIQPSFGLQAMLLVLRLVETITKEGKVFRAH